MRPKVIFFKIGYIFKFYLKMYADPGTLDAAVGHFLKIGYIFKFYLKMYADPRTLDAAVDIIFLQQFL